MKVLFAVWECAPFIKVGGLGDVARSLPKSLKKIGVDIRVIIPAYKAIKTGHQKRISLGKIYLVYSGKRVKISIFKIHFPDAEIPVYLLKNKNFFDVPGKDTWQVFDMAVVKLVKEGVDDWKPDIIHCNDNHCSFIPLLVKTQKIPVKTLFSIHSMLYQRRLPINTPDKMGIDRKLFRTMEWESKNKRIVGLLEGIIHADIVNTVSPTYAKEILTEEYGAGLDDIIKDFPDKITGILNGVDGNLRDPSHINQLTRYDQGTVDKGKFHNKKSVQKKLGLSIKPNIPLIGFVGRLEPVQKGIDLIHKMLLRIKLDKYQFIILGEGQVEWEDKFRLLASFNPKNIAYIDKYTDDIASKVYSACDFILIPSRFEPCCLIQMIAMRYGTIPIARATGGLKDTIKDDVTGFLFAKATSHDLEDSLNRAVKIYRKNPKAIHFMRQTVMSEDFSWDKSAQKYLNLYQKLVKD